MSTYEERQAKREKRRQRDEMMTLVACGMIACGKMVFIMAATLAFEAMLVFLEGIDLAWYTESIRFVGGFFFALFLTAKMFKMA